MICRIFGHRWKATACNRRHMDIEFQCERCKRQKHWSGYFGEVNPIFLDGPLPKK